MHCVTIQSQSTALGNVHPIVHEVLSRAVRCDCPEWSVHTENFFNYSTNEGKILLIFGSGQTRPADNSIELAMGTKLDVRMLANES